ncbi:hypothetical protein [Streptacidiphilus carbonis]|uniref:hypothetical protein n=1 Tax=Streptacidiphilus carbonis TaxID=105422 RepID=UPI0005AA6B15|nr:hypothetical protein [Streptacidiphilus carbonis]
MTESRLFVIWLDASDGSVITHDGVQWPDGTVSIRNRNHYLGATWGSPETAAQMTHGKLARVVWADEQTTEGRQLVGECGYVRRRWDGPYRMDDRCIGPAGHADHGPWQMLPTGPPTPATPMTSASGADSQPTRL